jgi:hypothetical protein
MQKAVAEVDRRTLVEEEPARGVKPGGMTEFTPRAILCGLVVAGTMGAMYPYMSSSKAGTSLGFPHRRPPASHGRPGPGDLRHVPRECRRQGLVADRSRLASILYGAACVGLDCRRGYRRRDRAVAGSAGYSPRLIDERLRDGLAHSSSGGPLPALATSSCLIRSALNFEALAVILSRASSKSNESAFEKRV